MRHSSTCVDNTIIYLGIQYLRKYALGTPWIFVILPIWTSTWIIFLSCTSPNKRGFQSYNKRCFSFKGSYLGFIALKEIQIRFATVPILNREGGDGGREGEAEETPLRQAATRWKQRSSVGVTRLLPANVDQSNFIQFQRYKLLQHNSNCWNERVFFVCFFLNEQTSQQTWLSF